MKKLALASVLLLGYVGAWFLVASRVEQKVAAHIAAGQDGQRRVEYESLHARGFPFPNQVELRNAHFSLGNKDLDYEVTVRGTTTISAAAVKIDGFVTQVLAQRAALGSLPQLQVSLTAEQTGQLIAATDFQAFQEADSLGAWLDEVQELQGQLGPHQVVLRDMQSGQELAAVKGQAASIGLTKTGERQWDFKSSSERDTLDVSYGSGDTRQLFQRLQQLAFPPDIERAQQSGQLRMHPDGGLHLDLSGTRQVANDPEYARQLATAMNLDYHPQGRVSLSLTSDGKIQYQDSWRQRWAEFAGLIWELSAVQNPELEAGDAETLSALGDDLEAFVFRLTPKEGLKFQLGLDLHVDAATGELVLGWKDAGLSLQDYGFASAGDIALRFDQASQARLNVAVALKETDYRQLVDDLYGLAQDSSQQLLPKLPLEAQQRLVSTSLVMRALREPAKEILRQLADDPQADPKAMQFSLSYDASSVDAPLRIGRLTPQELQAMFGALLAFPDLPVIEEQG